MMFFYKNKPEPLAKMIEHSVLLPIMTDVMVREYIVAMKYNVASVFIKLSAIPFVATSFQSSDVKVATIIGFPHGNSSTDLKVAETAVATESGAVEIDMVINIEKDLTGKYGYVIREIRTVNEVAVCENDCKSDEYITEICDISSQIKVPFVKTSTGHGLIEQENGLYPYKEGTAHRLRLMCSKSPPENHIETLPRQGIHVKGVLGSQSGKSRVAVVLLAEPVAHDTMGHFLSDKEEESIHVTSPNIYHFEQVRQLLQASKNAMCQKASDHKSCSAYRSES